MKYGSVNLGQIEALINILGGEAVLRSILEGTSKVKVEIIRRLTALTLSAVEASDVDLKKFFAIRAGLWTSENFRKLILAGVSEGNVSVAGTAIFYADLMQAANEAQIGDELPKDHVFEKVDTFLVHLATLIRGQWDGKEGVLLNNGHCNIFYVKQSGVVFSVGVIWSDQSWLCYADRLGCHGWDAGNRAFSPAAA